MINSSIMIDILLIVLIVGLILGIFNIFLAIHNIRTMITLHIYKNSRIRPVIEQKTYETIIEKILGWN